jgi:hypothetical protein
MTGLAGLGGYPRVLACRPLRGRGTGYDRTCLVTSYATRLGGYPCVLACRPLRGRI